MVKFNEFLGDDAGAVTIDWVTITAFILILGIVVVYTIFNDGVALAVGDVNTVATGLTSSIEVGTPPDSTTFGG